MALERKAETKEEKQSGVLAPTESKHSVLDLKIAAFASHSGLPFIDKLPEDVLLENVLPHLSLESDLKTTNALTKVCMKSYNLFQHDLNRMKVNKLLQHIARGEEEEAKKIIATNPKLLLERRTAKDYSGNTIKNVTPFELAYGADDGDMCKMMLPYVDQLPHGREEISKQIKERFPESKEEKSYDFSPLVAAISTNTHVEAALEKFREDFKPRVISKGKHFNVQTLLDAMQVYLNNYNPWSNEQRSIFWRQVIGYLQRMLPTCYAQAFCQGLYNVTYGKQPLKRNLKLKDGSSFYPADPSSHSGVGFDFGVYSYMVAGRQASSGGPGQHRVFMLSNLISSKNIKAAKLMQRLNNQAEKRCVIM